MSRKKTVKVVNVINPIVSAINNKHTGRKIKMVAAYCRVSSNHIEQKSSYLAQIDEYTNRIKKNSEWEFAGIYADEGKSGTRLKGRLQFNKMIKDCKEGKIDLIITKSISRFARNVEVSVKVVRELKAIGVEVFFEKENISSFDGKSEMIFTILASVAQEESRNISENSYWGIEKKMKSGHAIVNCNRFLGYDKDEEGNLVINEKEAEVVRYIYKLYLEGYGYSAIAKKLESKKFLTGAGKSKWHGSTVSGILKNEKYCGHLLLQKTYTIDYLTHKRAENKGQLPKYEVKDNHEPIISEETWLAVQKKIEEKFENYSGGNMDRTKYISRYGFSGRLICNHCGDTLKRRHWNVGTVAERIVWQCNGYIRGGKRTCDTKAVGDITIKMAFVDLYNQIIADKGKFFDSFIKTIENVIKNSPDKENYKDVEKDIKQIDCEISELIQMKIRNEISLDDFNREYTKINECKDKLLGVRSAFIEEQVSTGDKKQKIARIKEIICSNDNPLTDYEDDLFISLIQKVMVDNPVTFTFVLQNGMEIPIDATKHHDGRQYKNKK